MIQNNENEILIVEDTVASLKLLSDILSGAGYKVRPASDGELALRSISAKLPSLILLDIRMPGIDGYEVCRRLKADERTKEIPVIFLSSLSDTIDKVTGFKLGAVDYITKPFQREELLARVQTHINLHTLQNNLESLVEDRTAELLRSENDFRQKAEELRIVADYASNWEYWTDTDRTYRYISPSCEKISGYTREEFYENPNLMVDIIHSDDKLIYQQHLNDVTEFHLDHGATMEFKIVTKSGEIRYIEHVCKSIYNEQGNWLGQRGCNIDITERKIAEEKLLEGEKELKKLYTELEIKVIERTRELKEANEQLQELDQLKSMFIASMSHELRTPLNSIIGFTGVLLQGLSGPLNEKQIDQLRRVKSAGEHLLTLISDVIDISKIEAGRVTPFPEYFFLDELLKEAYEEVEILAKQKGLELEMGSIPLIEMFSDKKRLYQCLLNYLSNAIKFTVKGKVILGAENGEDRIRIWVKDTGIGISEKDKPRLFEAFERLETHLRVLPGGTGLGLYLTRKITETLLQGSVWVESKEGEGSVFGLVIPRKIRVEEQQ